MKKVFCVGFFCICGVLLLKICADAQEPKDWSGRYTLQQVTIDNTPMVLLLDTKTGKLWVNQKKQEILYFKGVSVEGVSYSSQDLKNLDQVLNDWSVKGLLDKDIKGFNEQMAGTFSFVPDYKTIKTVNMELSILQQAEKKKE